MERLFKKGISWLLLLGFVVLMASMFTGCKSEKKIFEKKKETVSVLEKKDVEFDHKIETNLDILFLDKSKSYTYVPVDPEKPSRVVHGKDTLDFTNTRIEVNENDVSSKTKDNSVIHVSGSDKTETEIDSKQKQINEQVEKKGTSPALIWGGLLFLFLAGIIWYFRKYIPFL